MTTSASPRPGRVLDPAKRAAILEGARAVFMREGFAQGSMDAVAAEAGVGKQTVYRRRATRPARARRRVPGAGPGDRVAQARGLRASDRCGAGAPGSGVSPT